MKTSILLLFFLLPLWPIYGEEGPFRDPVGERADYSLVKTSARTSRAIRSGKATTTVVKFIPAVKGEGGDFQVDFTFEVRVLFLGRKKETQTLKISSDFFEPGFMVLLRRNKKFISDEFKMNYLGQENVKTRDGKTYPQCDKVSLYDIKLAPSSPLEELFRDVLVQGEGALLRPAAGMENLTITAWVKEGVPVLGAVKIDLRGRVGGRSVKMGFDFKAPQ